MLNLLNRAGSWGLVINVAAALGVVLTINAIVFSFDWGSWNESEPDFLAPPGWVVALIWTTFFVLMGVARWLIIKSGSAARIFHSRLIVILLVLCALYPFYTLGLQSNLLGLIGNIVIVLLTIWTAQQISDSSSAAAKLIFLIVPWVLFASVIVVRALL